MMNPVKVSSYSNVLLRIAAINTCEELLSLDVLGLSDKHHQSKPDGNCMKIYLERRTKQTQKRQS